MSNENNLEKYKKIFELSPEAIGILDLKGNIRDMNERVYDWLGYKPREIIGKNILEVPYLDKKGKAEVRKNFLRRISGERVPPYEIEFFSRQGKKIIGRINVSLVKCKNKKAVGAIVMISNITEEKQAQKKLREIERTRTEFVSIASHQIRTSLTTINWYSEMLLRGTTDNLNHKQKEYLEEIHSANQQLIRLTNLLLSTSKIELDALEIKKKRVNLVRIVEVVINEMFHQIKDKKLKLEKKYPSSLIVSIDLDIMNIVLQNLLSNAIQYTPRGGKIEIFMKKQKNDAMIKISDTGWGIPKSEQSQIFNKFFRAYNARERNKEGTGLGLYIVKSTLEQCGGKIWFESKEGRGTTFHVNIPIKNTKKKQICGPKTSKKEKDPSR